MQNMRYMVPVSDSEQMRDLMQTPDDRTWPQCCGCMNLAGGPSALPGNWASARTLSNIIFAKAAGALIELLTSAPMQLLNRTLLTFSSSKKTVTDFARACMTFAGGVVMRVAFRSRYSSPCCDLSTDFRSPMLPQSATRKRFQ